MIHKYIFYTTDESFDYGDFPNSTYYYECEHGFKIDIDNPTMDTFEAFGDYSEMNKLKSLEEIKDYIIAHFKEVQEFEEGLLYPNIDIFIELVEILKEKINDTSNN